MQKHKSRAPSETLREDLDRRGFLFQKRNLPLRPVWKCRPHRYPHKYPRIPPFAQLNDAWRAACRRTPLAIHTFAMIGVVGEKTAGPPA